MRLPIRAIVLIALALAAAAGAAILLTRYMDARVAAARVPTAKVAVAKVDIPVATPIKGDWVELVDWPAAAMPPGAAKEPGAVVNRATVVPITRGEAILPAKLVAAGAGSGLATLLPEGMRAAAVKVDEVVGVAGFVRPGDRVDVIVTMQPRQEAPFMSKIVLQNLKVLAVGKELEFRGKDAKEAKPVTVATLMVTSEESERLALAANKGHVLLTLRGIGDEQLAETDGVTPPKLLDASLPESPKAAPAVAERPRSRPKAVAKAPAVSEPAPERQVVEILRGDLFEKRDFTAQEKKR